MAVEILYLVRHSQAEGPRLEGDRFRALTEEGLARIAALGPEAGRLGFQADLGLSSPYRRAVQTRDLFLPALGDDRRATTRDLTPDADPHEALAELKVWEAQGYQRIAVFTHNPLVTLLSSLLLSPGAGQAPVFQAPTILALGFEEGLQIRSGRRLWVLSP